MPVDPAPTPAFRGLSPTQLRAGADPSIAWLWDGYVAPGNVTLLTSPWKAGKTTLLAALLARLAGGGTLAGRPVRPGRAVVVSEESVAQWAARCAKFGIGDHVCLFCRPFRGQPNPADWQALLEHIHALHAAASISLVAIDPLAPFLPNRSEQDAAVMLQTLLPLQALTTAGVAVLLLHHPRKQASAAGQWARGSGALPGFVDILLEMHYHSTADTDDRRRQLLAYSRHDATPRRQVIELDAAGVAWLAHGDVDDEAYTHAWDVLRAVLADADSKLTRQELLAAWPDHESAPSPKTLYRWLERAVTAGQVHRDGTGRRSDPFRYCLPGQEAHWTTTDPFWRLREETEQTMRDLEDDINGVPRRSGRGKPQRGG